MKFKKFGEYVEIIIIFFHFNLKNFGEGCYFINHNTFFIFLNLYKENNGTGCTKLLIWIRQFVPLSDNKFSVSQYLQKGEV